MIAALLRSEIRKIASTRLWWGIGVPVVLLALLINVFGGAFALALGDAGGGGVPVLLGSLAYTLGLVAVFSAVHGAIATAGEFRHRTITTTYLIAPGRGPVLVAKIISAAGVGVVYALGAVLFGVVGGLLGQESARFPEVGALFAVVGVGVAVCALWSAFGAALGTILSNQVTVLVLLLVYVLLGELLVSALLGTSESEPVAQLNAFLPVNAGEVALYRIPADVIGGPQVGGELTGFAAGVDLALPWWGALLVLAAWTAAAAATAWLAGAHRDIT